MRKRCCLLAEVILGGTVLSPLPALAQSFTPTTARAQNWVSITSSADATKLAAAGFYGYLYFSTNSGETWAMGATEANDLEPQRPWVALASSRDGSKMVAVADFNPIFTSTNYGKTWLANGPSVAWGAVASSADGAHLVALDNDMGGVYTSTDSGISWTQTSAPAQRWRCVVSSADGTRLAAGAGFGTNYSQPPAIYTSVDSGMSWIATSAPAEPWQAIAGSADGTKLAAGVYGGAIYLSTDSGTNWTPASVPLLRWGSIASSADGTKLVAAAWEGQIYVSSDSGRTWRTADAPNAQWQAVTCSADGNKLIAGIWNLWNTEVGGIYVAQLPPALNISCLGTNALVSWPQSATGFTLQETSDPASSNWTDVQVTLRFSNAQNQATFPSVSGKHFYRLIHR
jgi:photosystem II stability/assembly factor-like uncharacterized protein